MNYKLPIEKFTNQNYHSLMVPNSGGRGYLAGERLNLGPDKVEPVLHLLEGGEQLGRVIAANRTTTKA